jgi:hypothetical protein
VHPELPVAGEDGPALKAETMRPVPRAARAEPVELKARSVLTLPVAAAV